MSDQIARPPGTRDFYPLDLAKRRLIEQAWRAVSIRHGFEEIDGPTFELTDLYAKKSGPGILSEIFQTFSGKDETQRAEVAAGNAPYALRPEFTPTLARMYAARAGQLPKPARWFWQSTCFRAERQQRGRLREFLQWNCDILGDEDSTRADVDAIACCVDLLAHFKLTPADVRVKFNHRGVLAEICKACGVDDEHLDTAFILLDRREKLDNAALEAQAHEMGLTRGDVPAFHEFLLRPRTGKTGTPGTIREELLALPFGVNAAPSIAGPIDALHEALQRAGISEWCRLDLNVARGLAYYTGTVFEVIVDGERAVAGGGRYDRLIETFGGPATPAVGFGMGDVVLILVLQDKGLMPSDREIVRTLGLRPDAFVISNGTPEADALVSGLLTRLRRGGLHARRSYKATKNIGKLLKD
ncbi:MAG: ATP phosphoribosyltransferase regulatory subunit, partial [Phycisphaerales bacterium]|nr:ATP phosphoribosyltransferase regulatory subunit [Phycisphaerales bacterium]